MDKRVISFPHLGNYNIPIEFLCKRLTKCEVLVAPKITKKTLELGNKHSPDTVCIPFKYNLGNYIEALDNGANILIQFKGGCRYSYYAEVQQQILKDLGYKFEFYTLTNNKNSAIVGAYKTFKKLNNKLSILKYMYNISLAFLMIYFMDKIDIFVRNNIGFEVEKNSFENLLQEIQSELKKTRGFLHLTFIFLKYKTLFKKIKINKPNNCIKIGIIGELYTCMEPFSNYFMEKFLANMNIQIKRRTDLTYLLITKRFNKKLLLKRCGKYCKYTIGADGMDNVAETKKLAELKYSGLIHIKPFGCTPEVGAITIIQKVCNDYNIPIIFLTIDSHTSEEGIKTRLEAFYEMIKMRGEKVE